MTAASASRREFLIGAGAAGLALAGRGAFPAAEARPNIVWIVADDLGYAELGVQGCRDIPTPHIDSIAANGVRFTNGYVSCPVCSPTRAGLMTGRYQQRFGHEFNPGPEAQANGDFGLPASETTLAERLKPLGYATGMVGKWHLGYRTELTPVRRGFDEFFGFLGGAHSYLPGTARGGRRQRNAAQRPAGTILRGMEPVEEKEYLTDAFAREAVGFVERHRNGPFFLYLPFNAVHAPLEAPETYLSRFSSIQDPTRRTFAAMLSAMDDAVGRVLGALREGGLDQDTLVFFHSDNGGPTPQTSSRNDPLRGYKGQVYEGGVRVPFLAQWKDRLPAGKVHDAPVIALDIHTTGVAAAGGTIPKEAKLDGVDLVPFLTGQKPGRPHESLCWRMGEQWAIRKGDLKLVAARGASPQLYDLATDVGESRELTSVRPEAATDLRAAYEAWDKGNVPPRWQRPQRAASQRRQRRRNAPQQ